MTTAADLALAERLLGIVSDLRIGIGVDAHALQEGVRARARRSRVPGRAGPRRSLGRGRPRTCSRSTPCSARPGWGTSARSSPRTTRPGKAPRPSTCSAAPTTRCVRPGSSSSTPTACSSASARASRTHRERDAGGAGRRDRRRSRTGQRARDDDGRARLHRARRGSCGPRGRAAHARLSPTRAASRSPTITTRPSRSSDSIASPSSTCVAPAATSRSVRARRWRNEPSKRLCLRCGS